MSPMGTALPMNAGIGGLALIVVAGCGVVSPPPAAPLPPPAPAKAEAPRPLAKPAAPQPAKAASPAPAPKPAPVAAKAPTLDLKSLEQRLKDTHAIAVMTKLALKNQVDDLV